VEACDEVLFASTRNYESALEIARRYENYVHFLEVAIEQEARLASESASDEPTTGENT
jgi:dihydroorotase-like cyclic amidohydrolase